MHTELKASELWCPMVRLLPDESADMCIASRCAMWRWAYIPYRKFYKAENRDAETEAAAGAGKRAEDAEFISNEENEGEGAGWIESEASGNARRTGYCGLAPLAPLAR